MLAVSCAYSGRIAVAYRSGGVKTRAESPHDQYVNLCVAIYQCESTGELTVHLIGVWLILLCLHAIRYIERRYYKLGYTVRFITLQHIAKHNTRVQYR